MTNERTNLYYDPKRDGYDTTIWKTVSWIPTLSSDMIRLNNSSIIWYDSIQSGDLVMALTIPAVPTAWDSRLFGFSQLTNGEFIGFNITDDVFKAQIIDSAGVSTLSSAIIWNAAWTAAVVNFRIKMVGFSATFYINDVQVANISSPSGIKYPLSMSISNSNSDNLDISSIQLKGADINNSNKINIGNLVTESYDYLDLSYTGANLTEVVYKSGGATGKTVATLALVYDWSSNITSITKI